MSGRHELDEPAKYCATDVLIPQSLIVNMRQRASMSLFAAKCRGRRVSDRDDQGVAPGYVMARRVILSVGGISVLAACTAQLQHTANVAQTSNLRPRRVASSAPALSPSP